MPYHLLNIHNAWGVFTLMIVWKLSGFASIHLLVSVSPGILYACTPKEHLEGFKCLSFLLIDYSMSLKSALWLSPLNSSQSYSWCRPSGFAIYVLRTLHPLIYEKRSMCSVVQKTLHCSSNYHGWVLLRIFEYHLWDWLSHSSSVSISWVCVFILYFLILEETP